MELELLIGSEEIEEKVKEIAEKIGNEYEGKKPLLVGVLKGSIVFFRIS